MLIGSKARHARRARELEEATSPKEYQLPRASIVRRSLSRNALLAGVVVLMALSAGVSWKVFHDTDINIAVTGSTHRPLIISPAGKVMQMPSGDYLAANTLVDTTGCSSTNVIAWNGTQFACAAAGGGGGGITNGAGNNVIMKSNGTNAIASLLTDDGTTVGIPTAKQFQLGTGIQAFRRMQITGAAATDEEMLWIEDNATGHVGTGGQNQAIALVLREQGTSDLTSADGTATGADIAVTQTRSAGTHNLTNTAILANASGGQSNFAYFSSLGDMTQTGPAHFGAMDMTSINDSGAAQMASLTNTGTSTLGTSGAGNATTINGTMDVRSSAADDYITITSTAAGGRKYYIESSATAGTQANTLNIYDNSAGLVRWYIDNNGSMTVAGGHYRTTGTAPTLSSCGTGAVIAGTDAAGVVTTGSATTTCTVTFALTYTTEPPCVLMPMGTATLPVYTVSATAITATTTIASTKYHYQCLGL